MLVAVIIAAPERADLTEAQVAPLAAALRAHRTDWLNPGIAAELALPQAPAEAELDLARAACAAEGFDFALLPAVGRRKAILLADMDSTIIGQECIDELAAAAGVGERVAEITARAMAGELDFRAALLERVGLLRGVPVATIDEVLERRITLAPGARELVGTMRANGAWTALISGGFTAFTGPVGARLGFDETRANVLLAADGALTGAVAEPILGREAKLSALHAIAAAQGLSAADVLAVGDGANDLDMIGAAGMGVALHAKPIVADAAQIAVDSGDLTALLYLQGYGVDEFVPA